MSYNQRELYETAVIERMKESGFLEVEIRVECLVRCDDGYQDEVINAGWHYWNAALAANNTPSQRMSHDEALDAAFDAADDTYLAEGDDNVAFKKAVLVAIRKYVALTTPSQRLDVDAKALEVVEAIFEDLRDRRFLKWLFDKQGDKVLIGVFRDGETLTGLDLEVQGQIKAAWQVIVAAALGNAAEGKP